MYETIQDAEVDNSMHSPKIQEMGKPNAIRAKHFQGKISAEVVSITQQKQEERLNTIFKTFDDPPAKPLLSVKRDMGTADSGGNEKITTTLQHNDAVATRAWQRIYDGAAGNMEAAINTFLKKGSKFAAYMLHRSEFKVKDIDGPMVYPSVKPLISLAQ